MHIEDAAERRLRVGGKIGMPGFAGDEFRLSIRVNGDDLGMVRQPGHAGMDHQRTEPPAEGLMGVMRQVLVAEEDHLMADERIVDRLELLVAELLSEVDAEDFGADPAGHRPDLDVAGLHGVRPRL